MTPELREQLHINILHQASAASVVGLTDSAFLQGARTQGYRTVDLEAVKTEIDQLAKGGFLAPVPRTLTGGTRKHRITPKGSAFLEDEA